MSTCALLRLERDTQDLKSDTASSTSGNTETTPGENNIIIMVGGNECGKRKENIKGAWGGDRRYKREDFIAKLGEKGI